MKQWNWMYIAWFYDAVTASVALRTLWNMQDFVHTGNENNREQNFFYDIVA